MLNASAKRELFLVHSTLGNNYVLVKERQFNAHIYLLKKILEVPLFTLWTNNIILPFIKKKSAYTEIKMVF